VSPLENFVALSLYFDELLRVVLPLTSWWHRKHLSALRRKAAVSGPQLDERLERAILFKLGRKESVIELRLYDDALGRRALEAAPLAALIGVFQVAQQHPRYINELYGPKPGRMPDAATIAEWIDKRAEIIARTARTELTGQLASGVPREKDRASMRQARPIIDPEEPPELITRVFLDREATLADTDANCTVKADAAFRVFDVSCRHITWAVMDSGIASSHPAFVDYDRRDRQDDPEAPTPTRVRTTLDFTRIEQIRSFDLTDEPDGSAGRQQAIDAVVAQLEALPGRDSDPKFDASEFRATASGLLARIARELDQRLMPSWSLIEPLILLGNRDNGAGLVSDHGTHVAGILAGDWRNQTGRTERPLRGVCPDMSLCDLRVIHTRSRRSTEVALVAAMEYVQFVNARAATNGPVIHGVNISLSIPHEVRNYACGATPVCVACDRLVSSGVVVVAAAGNRGWNEVEQGFGNFVFCSITDPGNARDVITVGSTHRLKPHLFGVSYFSSRGPTGDGRLKPDLVAPGEQIQGPVRGDSDEEMDGTSMAAPFVSGAAAMLLARNRELIGNPARIKQILCNSATDLGRERYFQGHGLVDILRAMQSL
jgi:hypothetical protein